MKLLYIHVVLLKIVSVRRYTTAPNRHSRPKISPEVVLWECLV